MEKLENISANSNETWLEIISKHYVFHFKKDSYAAQFIDNVIAQQEECFDDISHLLNTVPKTKIHYWLCDSRKEVANLSDYSECNGVTCCDDGTAAIYCVYNEQIKCIGYHEDTHAVAYFYNDTKSDALAEGLAMYMDKKWWSVENELCTLTYIENGKYVSVQDLLCGKGNLGDEYFLDVDDCYSYPIMGAFVGFLIEQKGKDGFLSLYAKEGADLPTEFFEVYGYSLAQAENEFVDYIKAKDYTAEQKTSAKSKLIFE